MKKLSYLLVSVLVSIFAISCTGQKKSDTQEATKNETAEQIQQNDAATLMGDWNVMTVEGVTVPQTEETPYLTFNIKDKRLAGMTGCNRVMADIILSDSDPAAILFDKMGSTKMMCHNDALETAVLGALAKVRSFAVIPCTSVNEKAHCIALYDQDKKEVMTLQQEPLINTEYNTTPQEN